MNCPQSQAIISHALSQITYRWLPLPAETPLDRMRFDPHSWGLGDWKEAVCAGSETELAWAKALRKSKMSPIGLATVIYDNLCKVQEHGAELIDFYHPHYPYLLRHIPDPPNCFMLTGTRALFQAPKVAIVGSRKASAFAFQQAQRLGRALAERGEVVVSGGALGCDAAAHSGCLHSSLLPVPTIVVFAGGLSKLYPAALAPLFSRLREGGALFLSERLWDFPPRPWDFPVRNRIIAGLSARVLVMQAAERSGAIHTATYALDQGRDVYVLVREAGDVRASGSQKLLDQGASAFLSSEDYLGIPRMQG